MDNSNSDPEVVVSTIDDSPQSSKSLFGRINEAKQTSNGNFGFLKAFLVIIFGTIGCTFFLGIVLCIPIAMIVIGAMNLHKCPAEPYIPIYLIVGGVFGLLTFLKDLFLRCNAKCKSAVEKSTCIGIISGLVQLFLFAWFIAGCVWVYRVYEPDYTDESSANYCDRTLYLFAFWLLNLSFICLGFLILCLCCGCVAILACAK